MKALEPNKRILVEWSAYGAPTDIEWVFTARADATTFVSITNSGFSGNPQEIASLAVGATEGFSFVLAGAKARLEHDLQLNLVPDRFPDGTENHSPGVRVADAKTRPQDQRGEVQQFTSDVMAVG